MTPYFQVVCEWSTPTHPHHSFAALFYGLLKNVSSPNLRTLLHKNSLGRNHSLFLILKLSWSHREIASHIWYQAIDIQMADAWWKKASRLKKKNDSRCQETHINTQDFEGRELKRHKLIREQERGERGQMTRVRHKRKLCLKHSEKKIWKKEAFRREVFQKHLFGIFKCSWFGHTRDSYTRGPLLTLYCSSFLKMTLLLRPPWYALWYIKPWRTL